METAIEKTILDFNMDSMLSHVLVGFSGGADSTALLHYLLARSRVCGTRVSALHVNHGIRGECADRDEDFCRRVCADWGVPLTVIRADVPTLAKERGQGIEETARQVRYSAFYEAMQADPTVTSVATAHNADDNAETVLFHMARGCGIDGLCGIPPVTDQRVIRPLLACSRKEIIAYCKGNNIQYMEDETNQDTRYTRNHIRHTVMDRMREINADFTGAVSRMCQALRGDGAYLDQLADEAYARRAEGASAKREPLLALPEPILSRVLLRMHGAVSDIPLAHVHREAILEALRGTRTDKDLDLPGGVVFSLSRDLVCFRKKTENTDFCYPLHPGENRFDDLKITAFLLFEEKKPRYNENIYKLSTYQRINFDTINGKVFIRSRREGDRYFTKNMTKSVKRWMCDSHIPRWRRGTVPLFCDESGIAYVRGMGLRDDLKTVEGCKILHLYLLEEDPY